MEAAEKLLPLFVEGERLKVQKTIELLRGKVLPLIRNECPLLVAVTGGGSVGKSTLFNLLAGGKFSGVKFKAGYTRRTLAAIHPSVANRNDRMELLFELFKKNAMPVPLKSPDEMLEPGDPLYVESGNIPERMAVLDTPDFDTGSREAFVNRDAAEEILAASDVLVYLFTNQTYNNKANTDFVRNAISGIGRRKVVLVYRCSAAYPDDEVVEHMDEVLRNLFPGAANPRSEALGLYRVDESDDVAMGVADPTIRPLSGGPDIMSLMAGLDISEVRKDNLRSRCEDIVREMAEALEKASVRRLELIAYRDSVRAVVSLAVLDGLRNFPQGPLMEQFIKCWRAAQPALVRVAHWGGRKISSGAKWLRNRLRQTDGDVKQTAAEEYEKTFRSDFKDCVGKLRAKLNQPALSVEVSSKAEDATALRNAVRTLASQRPDRYGFFEHGREKVECSVSKPAALDGELDEALRRMSDPGKDEWIEQAVEIACLNRDLTGDIMALVDEARHNMSFWEKSKESLWAAAATLPPIAAVTWIVCTGEPVAGSGVLAQLSALFGMGDIYAVLAVPASLGLDAANKSFLEKRLKSLYETWFERKRGPVYDLISENTTSRCTALCDNLLQATEAPLARLREAVDMACEGKENAG
ncbi:MAG: 50S ribosome-binding GTPase [Kiritimatiellae bacterium]|nr:50S ribosome-binding GTPase [Kiritimatiellia bacterium]